ncbi:hypothetical protein [Pseudomonas sp. KCJK8751]|uniref:hypothetical protein n=1 Tax=Pseudomonas sp. KCJK8751 TaxID=3344564 RepID=UPI003906031B
MDTNKMREMREAFERTNSRDHRRQPPKGNNYIDPMAQADWESFQKGWQASREAVVVELPKDIVTMAGPVLYADDVRAAIEAQGLKVEVKP